jgi:hypothetical protein
MAEVGIYYYRARTYDPSSGRFLQRDPLGYVDGFNLYEYANSNPINMSDPYGLKAEEDCDESCGPDVTRWLANQMILNKDHPVIRASRENVWADFVPFFNLGWNYGFFTDFRDLVKAGGPWDFKASQSFKSQSCPSSNCNSTVTMCGSCLDYDVPGNIHYGWVGVAARIRPWFLHNRAAAAQAGGVDDPADTVAIDIGISLWQQGGGSLCSLVNRYKSGLRKGSKDCQVCREAY